MRYGVFADVHANLPALEAVLDALAAEQVDAYLHAGDLVGYGPWPNECVERVASLGAVGVAGNHDLIALGRLTTERTTGAARRSLEWTQRVLSDAARAELARLPLVTKLDRVTVAHGSLDDPERYIRAADDGARELEQLPEDGVLVLGHTHHAWALVRGETRPLGAAVELAGRCLVNPGSVGQSRERRLAARFLVLDVERRQVVFRSVPYDVERARAELRRVGLPLDAIHVPPSRLAPVKRLVRRLV